MAAGPARSLRAVLESIAASDAAVRDAIDAGDRRALRAAMTKAFRAARPRIKAALLQHTAPAAEYAFAGALVGVQGAPALPRDPAVRWASGRAARLVTRMDAESKRVISGLVRHALAKGEHPHVLARELVRRGLGLNAARAGALAKAQGVLEAQVAAGELTRTQAASRLTRLAAQKVRSRAIAIARTEMLTARSGGRQAAWDAALERGVIDRFDWAKKWITNIDDRTDDVCEGLNGELTAVDGVFSNGLSGPPQHPACFSGDTMIAVPAEPPVGATNRRYEGAGHEIHVRGLEPLRVTPNHPILTHHGWIAAGLLREGDQVLCDRRWIGIDPVAVETDEGQPPARIDDVARALGESGKVTTVQVPLSVEDFHGDGGHGHVDVVHVDSELGSEFDAARCELFTENDFHPADFRFAADSAPDEFVSRPLLASGGGVSGLDLIGALFFGHLRPLQHFGFGAAPDGDAFLPQDAGNDVAGYAEPVGDALAGVAGQVTARDVVHVEDKPLRHVFNLQTRHGFYSASGVVVHNCRCSTGLVRV